MSASQSYGRSYAISAFSSGVGIAATLTAGILLARLLSVEDRGLVAITIYWATFAFAIGSLSLNEAFVLRSSQVDTPIRERLPSSLSMSGLMALITSVAVIALLFLYREQFGDLDIRVVIGFIVTFLLVRSLNASLIAVEQSSLKFTRVAIERTLLPIVYSVALLIVGLTGNLTVAVVLLIFLMSRSPVLLRRIWRFRKMIVGPVSLAEMRSLTAIGVRFHGNTVARGIAEQADKIVVSLQWSATSIANFAVAYSAAGAAYGLIGQALNLISLPVASKVSKEEISAHFASSIRITSILLVFIMIPIVTLAPALVPLVFGAKYESAIIYTQILAITLFPVPLVNLIDAMLRGRDETATAMRMHIACLTLFAAGWVATGYDEITTLGLGLAGSRLGGILFCLLNLRGELKGVRLLDCVLWQTKDFAVIFRTAKGLLPKFSGGQR